MSSMYYYLSTEYFVENLLPQNYVYAASHVQYRQIHSPAKIPKHALTQETASDDTTTYAEIERGKLPLVAAVIVPKASYVRRMKLGYFIG